jgi:hypothetical protein
MLQSILNCLLREYRTVTRAPLTFSTILVVAALIAGAAVWAFRGEADLLRRELADYRQKLHGASPDEAKMALETLTDEVTALEAQLRPRRLQSQQREIITEKSKVPSGTQYAVTIVYEGGCWDCPQYAADLDEAFRSIPGWLVSHRVMMGLPQRPPQGLAVVVGDPARPSAQESLLVQGLRAAGIGFDLQAVRSSREETPQLLLAAKAVQ